MRRMWWLEIMGRLKPGVSLEQANAALVTLQPGIRDGGDAGGRRRASSRIR